jgi:hypothetical protein
MADQIGIENKVRKQARAIASVGLEDLDIVLLNPHKDEEQGRLRFAKLRTPPLPFNYYDLFFRRYQLIGRSADLHQYDYLILRYPLADKSGVEFAEEHQVITEHNTNEPSELLSRLRMATSPQERLARRLFLFLEKRYAARILRNCRGIIGITNEIRAFEQRRAGVELPTIAIANGVDVESIPITGFKRFDGRNLDILFVASFLRQWHGLDRLVASLERYRGSVSWTLHVVGNIGPDDVRGASSRLEGIKFYGPKTASEMTSIVSNMNLAVSSLAQHRIDLKEACSLKTREYTSRGIPFILAYEDPDLAQVDENNRFYLALENSDSLLDIQSLLDFATAMGERQRDVSAYMRAYALEHMDWRVKMQKYHDFVRITALNSGRHDMGN